MADVMRTAAAIPKPQDLSSRKKLESAILQGTVLFTRILENKHAGVVLEAACNKESCP